MPPKKDATSASADAKSADLQPDTHISGEFTTTNQGIRINDDNNSLRVGARGPTLLEDFHFREKIMHFDHERIPERVVHARGEAAHGYFQVYEPLTDLTKAQLFQDPSAKTPVFVRFSTVAGSRGSADTPRDVRGFAVKFYTDEGVWDLVGNNIPIFFIQDAIKFPDLIHAVKPEPHNEIPQAASAHDTFWDFVSLTPESTHMLMWVMSDRALPRSLSRMEGFGIHTFRLVNAEGKAHFVKFHWKPVLGVHSLVWDESQKISGKDADFHRRDLWESIEMGNFPEWELGLQIIPESDEFAFDFDLLDPTKIVPEELVPVRKVGKMVLNRNPDNFFAETEQVAFCPGHIVPGVDFTNDPLLQGRLFSYLDTQIKRVGPNFAELPINRPTCPVNNNQRDAQARIRIDRGRTAYFPNSLAKNCPMHSGDAKEAFTPYAEKVEGVKIRQRSESFGDHFSQATLFWNSMADWEKTHIVDAFSFELSMVETKAIRERVVNELLANVNNELATRVAKNLGLKAPAKSKTKKVEEGKRHVDSSPALSIANLLKGTVKGRKIAVLVADGFDGDQVNSVVDGLMKENVDTEVISQYGGTVKSVSGDEVAVDKITAAAASVFYDGVYVPGGRASVDMLLKSGAVIHFINEAYRHCKTIAASGEGLEVLKKASIGIDGSFATAPGVIATSDKKASDLAANILSALAKHRHFERETDMVPA